MKYGFFDPETGKISTACNDDAVIVLPNGAIALTDEQFSNRFSLRLQGGLLIAIEEVVQATDAQLLAALKKEATALLLKTDATAIRCFKAGVVFPESWQSYVSALRAIVRADTWSERLTVPPAPEYPAGTF